MSSGLLEWPKPILPIDGKPVIATLLRELAGAGIEAATVVTGHLPGQVEELVGDGSAFGLEARFARQPGVLGSADAVQRGVAAGAVPPFLVTAADTVYSPGDVGRFADAFSRSSAAGAIAVRREPAGRQPVRVRDGFVEKLLDDDASNPLSAARLLNRSCPWADWPTNAIDQVSAERSHSLARAAHDLRGTLHAACRARRGRLGGGREERGRSRDISSAGEHPQDAHADQRGGHRIFLDGILQAADEIGRSRALP